MTGKTSAPLSGRMLFLMALGAGLSVASIYYSQPMLGLMSADYQASVTQIGLVPTLTQVGYALGILFLAPLGDRFDRRTIILLKGLLLMVMLLLCSYAPSLQALLVASLAIGLAATVAQDIIPAAAHLASEAQRGKTVGTVMTGLLAGILLSRVFSGITGGLLGWRSIYLMAAAGVLLVILALWRALPHFTPGTEHSYPRLLASLGQLWLKYPALRKAAVAQGLLSVGFSAFWSTLAIFLAQRYQLGSATAGAFGLAGAAGALAAPLAGMIADRRGPYFVTRAGSALVALSFALMFLLPLLPVAAQLTLVAISAVLFDLGLQASLVAHQTIIYGLEPAARSRLNALMFTVVFVGMASGSVLGGKMLALWGWEGVVSLAVAAALAAFLVRLTARDPGRPALDAQRDAA